MTNILEAKPEWPSVGSKYYYITPHGGVGTMPWDGDGFDEACKSIGNVFCTEKEAEAEVEKRKAIVRVSNAINELNEAHEGKLKKFVIVRDEYGEVTWARERQKFNAAHTIPYCHSKKIVKEIMAKFEADIKLIIKVG